MLPPLPRCGARGIYNKRPPWVIMRPVRAWSATWLASAALCAGNGPARAEPPIFDVIELPSTGRSVAVELADLDGDGRTDLLEVAFQGVPPDERRRIRVRFQTAGGGFAREPDMEALLPPESAAYDLADLIGGPGQELVLLGARGFAILAFEDGVQTRRLTVPDGVTLGAAPDERGLERLELVTRDLDERPLLVAPGLGETFLLGVGGELRARLAVGGRANYFADPPHLLMSDSAFQLFFDAPRLGFGDVDGDGRADVVAAGRHEIRVFLRRPDDRFASEPDRTLWLRRVSPEDHVRGSGAVRSLARDLDADGRLDLVIAQISGGILDSRDETSVFLNRDGGWNLEAPDALFRTDHVVSGVRLIDLDADGRLELLRMLVPVNVLELVELLVTRSFDVRILAYGMDAEGRFASQPRFERRRGVALDFASARTAGFLPIFDGDWNGDGVADLMTSGDGTYLEVSLGSREGGYGDDPARQVLETAGRAVGGDVDGDGLADLLIFNPRIPDSPLRLCRNRGALPGTRPSLRVGPLD